MKTLGIIGGLGPESTVDYYRFIIAEVRRRKNDNSSPPMLIDSLDIAKGIVLVGATDLGPLVDYISEATDRLARAGVDFALIAANTPHIAFDDIQRRSRIPLLSIVEATRDHALKLGMKRLALLGTGFTMRGRFYPDVFSRAGIELVLPTEEEKSYIHGKYLNELLKNVFLPETRDHLLAIVDRLASEGVEGVIMAGTELPLLLRGSNTNIPFLDTTLIHVNAAVDRMLKND
jgi:aspartate racemase